MTAGASWAQTQGWPRRTHVSPRPGGRAEAALPQDRGPRSEARVRRGPGDGQAPAPAPRPRPGPAGPQGPAAAAGRPARPYLSSAPSGSAEGVRGRRRGLPAWADSPARPPRRSLRDPRPHRLRAALPGSAGDLGVITHATAAAPTTRKWAGRAPGSAPEVLQARGLGAGVQSRP